MSFKENSEIEIKNKIERGEPVDALVAVFDSNEYASKAIDEVELDDSFVHRLNLKDLSAGNQVPEISFDQIDKVGTNQVANGVVRGSMVGAGTGLLFMAIPGFNIAAPIAGALAGAWIGGIAAIDETDRRIQLPNRTTYQKMLNEGKALIVIFGDRKTRQEYEWKLDELGATTVFQHPPIYDAGFTESSGDKRRGS